MVFENETPWPALLSRSVLDTERIAASVVVRVTYSWRGRELHPADEQVWPVSPIPWTSPRGPMEADGPFLRGGVDLFVFGSACAESGKPISAMDLSVEVPGFARRARVTGDRVWVRRGESFEPSEAVPFERIPLTLAHAFGGASEWDGLEVKFMENPAGKGFCVDEEQAEGASLPNIEESGATLKSWNDARILLQCQRHRCRR